MTTQTPQVQTPVSSTSVSDPNAQAGQPPAPQPLNKAEMAAFEKKVSTAKALLILDHPFFGTAVSRRPIIYTYTIPTAAMSATGQMYINPAWCQVAGANDGPLSLKQMMFLLAHEALHYMLMHGLRMQHRDPKAWNVACVTFDAAVTMLDGSTKPAGLIVPGDVVATPFGGGHISDVVFTSKQGIMELELDNGYQLRCTSDHKILTQRGYVHAEELRPGEDACAVDTRYGSVRAGQLPHDVRQGYGGAFGADPTAGLFPTGAVEAGQGPDDTQADELERAAINDGAPGGVSGGGRGRGRHDQLPNEEEPVSALCAGVEHGPADVRVAGFSGYVRGTGGEHERQVVLAHVDERAAGGRPSGAASAVSHGEETAGGTVARSYPGTPAAYQQLYPDHQHAEAVQGAEGVELRKVSAVRRLEGARTVVDLVSSQQCFYAEGVVVHNCDKVINDTLIDANVGEFIEGGINFRGGKDYAAEELYDENDNGQGQGPGGIGNDVGNPTDGNGNALDESQRRQIEAQAKIEAVQCAKAAKAVGKLPGAIERMIDQLVNVQTPWQDILERFMVSRIKDGKSWTRPNRRFVGQGIYLPGDDMKPKMGTIVLGVDTSGSIGQAELNYFGGHLNRILEVCNPEKVIVVYCDAAVAHVDEYEPDDMPVALKPYGGGGTAFHPVFEYIDAQGIEPEVVVYLTDGYSSSSFTTQHETVWLTTHSEAFEFGTVIKAEMGS